MPGVGRRMEGPKPTRCPSQRAIRFPNRSRADFATLACGSLKSKAGVQNSKLRASPVLGCLSASGGHAELCGHDVDVGVEPVLDEQSVVDAEYVGPGEVDLAARGGGCARHAAGVLTLEVPAAADQVAVDDGPDLEGEGRFAERFAQQGDPASHAARALDGSAVHADDRRVNGEAAGEDLLGLRQVSVPQFAPPLPQGQGGVAVGGCSVHGLLLLLVTGGPLGAPRSPAGWSWQPWARLPDGCEPRAGLREMPSRRLRDYLPHPRAGRRPLRRCPDRKRQPPAPPRGTAASRPSGCAGWRISGPEPGKGAIVTAGTASRTAHLLAVMNKGGDLRPGPPGARRGSVTRTGTRGLVSRLLSHS